MEKRLSFICFLNEFKFEMEMSSNELSNFNNEFAKCFEDNFSYFVRVVVVEGGGGGGERMFSLWNIS